MATKNENSEGSTGSKTADKNSDNNPKETNDDDGVDSEEWKKKTKGPFNWREYYDFMSSDYDKLPYSQFDELTLSGHYETISGMIVQPLLIVHTSENTVRLYHNLYNTKTHVVGMFGGERQAQYQALDVRKLLTIMKKKPSDKRTKFNTKEKIPTINDFEQLYENGKKWQLEIWR